jgi:hypothetical protein
MQSVVIGMTKPIPVSFSDVFDRHELQLIFFVFVFLGLLILIPVLDWSLTAADGESTYFLDQIQADS